MTNAVPAKDETVRKINRAVVKYVAIRVATGVGFAVAGSLIANAIDRKLNDSDTETTED